MREVGHQVDMSKVSPTDTLDLFELEDWAKHYSKFGPYAQAPNVRYYIGIYQVGQGLTWAGTDSEYESYASGAIHFLGAAGMLNVSIAEMTNVPVLVNLRDPKAWQRDRAIMNVTKNMSMGMMHVHYAVTTSKSMKRKSRYDPMKLRHHVLQTVVGLFSLIPKEKRAQSVLLGTKIMTGAL